MASADERNTKARSLLVRAPALIGEKERAQSARAVTTALRDTDMFLP